MPVPDVSARNLSKSAVDTFRQLAGQSQRMTRTDLQANQPPACLRSFTYTTASTSSGRPCSRFILIPNGSSTGAYVKVGFFRSNDDLLYHEGRGPRRPLHAGREDEGATADEVSQGGNHLSRHSASGDLPRAGAGTSWSGC